MKVIDLKQSTVSKLSIFGGAAILSVSLAMPLTTAALDNTTSTSNTTKSSNTAETTATRLANIKSRGDDEITRRLTQLNKLTSIVNNAKHVTSSDLSALIAQVNAEITGLTNLKTQLDNETTLDAAIADAKNIVTEYRVYALITPKVWIIKAADDEQVNAQNLLTLATKLQTRITTAQQAGKNVTSLQTSLNDLKTKATNAQTLAANVETHVIGLQPSDYNSYHMVLTTYISQVRQAHADNQAAYNDAKDIVNELKNL